MILDLVGPERGPCGFCGDGDARHRVADSVVGYVQAGESPMVAAADFGLTIWAVLILCAVGDGAW